MTKSRKPKDDQRTKMADHETQAPNFTLAARKPDKGGIGMTGEEKVRWCGNGRPRRNKAVTAQVNSGGKNGLQTKELMGKK